MTMSISLQPGRTGYPPAPSKRAQPCPDVRGRRRAAGAARLWSSLALLLLVFALCVNGCATLRGAKPPAAAHTTRTFDAARLHSGMLMDEVRRLEGPPQQTISTSSQSMSITEWIYEGPHGETRVYFANGVLESWSS